MTVRFSVFAALVLAALTFAAPAVAAGPDCAALTCRPNGQPYVNADGSVIVLPGESFAVVFDLKNGQISNPRYAKTAPDGATAVSISFQGPDPNYGMMLTVQNPFALPLRYEGFMDFGDGDLQATTICTIFPKIAGIESWGDPIKRLVLKDFRVLAANAGMTCE